MNSWFDGLLLSKFQQFVCQEVFVDSQQCRYCLQQAAVFKEKALLTDCTLPAHKVSDELGEHGGAFSS